MRRLRQQIWRGSVLFLRGGFQFLPFGENQVLKLPSIPTIITRKLSQTSSPRQRTKRKIDTSQHPSPPLHAAQRSAKLAALHARLSLPSRLPLQTLARSLIDPTADPSPLFNNLHLSVLGKDLLSYYTSEHIICRHPRLPMAVVFAATYAFIGPKAMRSLIHEWGVEHVAEPGHEVDPGLLQFRQPSKDSMESDADPEAVNLSSRADGEARGYRRGMSSRTVYDDEFGDIKIEESPIDGETNDNSKTTPDSASQNFIRALMGAIYVHGGRTAAKEFFRNHITSRQLTISNLFSFRQPTRDLSRLCAREGFQAPVARLVSETGRKSRHPVFNVGIFSGSEKLGEAAGSSLDEARTRASVAALKAWYLYSPPNFRVPSEMEEDLSEPWKPIMVDPGDIVV
ncbi:MAG: hypothetical protein Q9227_001557 [Pyrenula ochraceoflavens]